MELSRIQLLASRTGWPDVSVRRPLLDALRPDTQVPDLSPARDGLAIASQWRGCSALEEAGPARQHEPGALDGLLVLFEPATAQRSAHGVALSSSRREGSGSATEASPGILDTGEVVRTVQPAVEGETCGRSSDLAISVPAGSDRVQSDLPADPATTNPDMELWKVPPVPVAWGTDALPMTPGPNVTRTEVGRIAPGVGRLPREGHP